MSEPSFIARVTCIRHYSCCYLKVANPYTSGYSAEQMLSTEVSSSYFREKEAVLKIPLPPAWFWVKAAIAKEWTCNEFISDEIFIATYTYRKLNES
jgi:hypothetical protein